MSKRIAITCGDTAGVGLDVLQKWIQENPEETSDTVLLGPADWQSLLPSGDYEFLSLGYENYKTTPGQPSTQSASIAFDALERASIGCVNGDYSAVVTAPVSKSWMRKVGFNHPGHTEYFAERWGGEPTMGFCGERMRVVLATWHIPLMRVSENLSFDVIERAVVRASLLAKSQGAEEPRIAVCGLNPHAGEDGLLGSEEQDFIDKHLDVIRKTHSGVSRTLPGDTVFFRQLQGEFDVVVALYHDQGLAPLKTVEFDSAVNVTLGLPYIRTSPDHGTAYDIAGTGKANAGSFTHAVKLARQLIPFAQC